MTSQDRLDPATVAEVTALCSAAADADGVFPLSEHVVLHLRHGGEGLDRHLLARDDDGVLTGYGHLDPTDAVAGASAELVVHPAHRGHGVGRALVTTALDVTEQTSPGGRLRLWAHGDHPAARALAASLGFEQTRTLLQMRRSLLAPLPVPALPPGVRLRTFRPGADDEEWLALNAAAFAGHPEQGAWTSADLKARLAESWFDADGFLVAVEVDGDVTARMVGFHWTKVHGGQVHGEGADRHAHEPIGEVYVVGVAPWAQGRRLGTSLTVAGLRWLRSRGLAQAMLYVDGDNAPALATYTSLGFSRWDTDVMFSRSSTVPVAAT